MPVTIGIFIDPGPQKSPADAKGKFQGKPRRSLEYDNG